MQTIVADTVLQGQKGEECMTYIWCDGIMASGGRHVGVPLDGGWSEFLEMKDWVGQFNTVLSSSLRMPRRQERHKKSGRKPLGVKNIRTWGAYLTSEIHTEHTVISRKCLLLIASSTTLRLSSGQNGEHEQRRRHS